MNQNEARKLIKISIQVLGIHTKATTKVEYIYKGQSYLFDVKSGLQQENVIPPQSKWIFSANFIKLYTTTKSNQNYQGKDWRGITYTLVRLAFLLAITNFLLLRKQQE